jgi:hypothetical protein
MRDLWSRSVVLALVLSSLVSHAAQSDPKEAIAAEASAISASVSSVAAGGDWGGNGFFRLVVMRGGFEHVHYRAYAQWIKDPTSNYDGPRLEKSVEVRDLSDILSLGVGAARFVSGSTDSAMFEVDIYDNESSKKSTARVHLGKPGEVSVEMPPKDPVE